MVTSSIKNPLLTNKETHTHSKSTKKSPVNALEGLKCIHEGSQAASMGIPPVRDIRVRDHVTARDSPFVCQVKSDVQFINIAAES